MLKQSLFVLLIFLSSCYSPRYVYSPVTQNIPMVRKKNDVQAAAYIAGGTAGTFSNSTPHSYNIGMDLHLAYAFTNHFVVLANQYNRWERNNSNNDVVVGDSIQIRYKRGLTEFAGGYFSSFNHVNTSFQFLAGFAFGSFNIAESNARNTIGALRYHNSNVEKFFIQPAIISGISANFTATFSSRISMVYYKNITTNYSFSELNDYFLSDLSTSPVFFWEPSMTYLFGSKHIHGFKLETQMGLSVLLNKRFVDYRTLNVALGVVSDFKWKPKTKTSTVNPGKKVTNG